MNSPRSFLLIAQIRGGSMVTAKELFFPFPSRKAISPKVAGLIIVIILSSPSGVYLTIFTLPVFKKKMALDGSFAK